MEVIIRPTPEEATDLVAALIADAIQRKPNIVLGLATGRTMDGVYERLVKRHTDDDLSFARVATFNLDEYVGLAPESPQSYRSYMHERLFSRVDIDPENAFLPNGTAADLDEESARYERLIAERGGIDLQVLGIGRTGHIGFNEPLSALRSRTRVKALTRETLEQNAEYFGGDVDAVPHRAITMGVGTIVDSRRCLLVALGSEKAEIVAKAVEGPVTSMISATALQLHPRCTVIVDGAAARDLSQAEYYRWIFDNEPEWEPYR